MPSALGSDNLGRFEEGRARCSTAGANVLGCDSFVEWVGIIIIFSLPQDLEEGPNRHKHCIDLCQDGTLPPNTHTHTPKPIFVNSVFRALFMIHFA